jgi:hypothetical protein
LRAKAASVYQTRQHAFFRQSLEVCTGFAESNTAKGYSTERELLANEMVERDTSSYDIASGIAWLQVNAVIALQRLDGLNFN